MGGKNKKGKAAVEIDKALVQESLKRKADEIDKYSHVILSTLGKRRQFDYSPAAYDLKALWEYITTEEHEPELVEISKRNLVEVFRDLRFEEGLTSLLNPPDRQTLSTNEKKLVRMRASVKCFCQSLLRGWGILFPIMYNFDVNNILLQYWVGNRLENTLEVLGHSTKSMEQDPIWASVKKSHQALVDNLERQVERGMRTNPESETPGPSESLFSESPACLAPNEKGLNQDDEGDERIVYRGRPETAVTTCFTLIW